MWESHGKKWKIINFDESFFYGFKLNQNMIILHFKVLQVKKSNKQEKSLMELHIR